MRKKELGPENPDTLQIKAHIATDILYKEKRYVSALKFFLTLEKKTAFLGSKHFLVKNCHEHIDCISAHFKALGEEKLVEKLKNDVRQTSENKENSFARRSNMEMGESNPLQEVVAKGETEKLKILLERGVDVLQVFEGGNTILHVAAAQGQSATADNLIRHCQDRHRRILQNVIVEDLFSCVQNGKCDDVVGKIEALDSDVAAAATRACNSSGKTLLLVALQTNQKDFANELGKWLKRQKRIND
ncbi:hypothetical protein CEXT_366581 [Caerostris extrusa]|uniref:Uncharacterized protein n=1 Tax=Caerostris extrusa TaxID=172846 RepID=A0AAV4YFJ3_CAEEX|nr:hypothetical protein CEXT_366581 [Caerostris extrusa]